MMPSLSLSAYIQMQAGIGSVFPMLSSLQAGGGKMEATFRKIKILELTEDMMFRAAGGRFLRGLFGTHCLGMQEEFHVIAKDGTDYSYAKWKCRDCDDFFYTVERKDSGQKEEITLSEFRRARSMAEAPESLCAEAGPV